MELLWLGIGVQMLDSLGLNVKIFCLKQKRMLDAKFVRLNHHFARW